MRANGRVYVLTNPSMPKLIKIGYTDRTAQDRADELYFGYGLEGDRKAVTGVPTMYEVRREWLVGFNAEEVEQMLHDKFDYERVNDYREFFDKDILPEVDKEMAQYERLDDFQYSEPSLNIAAIMGEEEAKREMEIFQREHNEKLEKLRAEYAARQAEEESESKTKTVLKAVSDQLFKVPEPDPEPMTAYEKVVGGFYAVCISIFGLTFAAFIIGGMLGAY